ncbi:MAG TPA: MFS transporter [Roseiflexaceae bacterium]
MTTDDRCLATDDRPRGMKDEGRRTDVDPSSPVSRWSSEARGTKIPAQLVRGFRALRVRNYRLFFIGQLISLTGSWMQTTAQAWLVLELTRSPLALGLVTTLQFLPLMLFSLVGGVIADRAPKRQLILITQTAAMLLAAIFGTLVATGAIQLWHVYVLAMLQGVVNAVDNPVRQAFSVELVGRDEMINAVALNSMLFNGARIVGPAVAGVMIASIGIAPVLYLNAVSFIAVIAGLLMMDPAALRAAPARTAGGVAQRLYEGLRYSWRTPDVLLIMIVVGAIGTFGYNFSVVLPLIAGFVLHTDAAGFGALSAFLGIGSLAAAIGTAYARQVSLRRLLIGAGSFSALLGALALSPFFTLSSALLVALGFAGITFATTANSLLQLSVPDELRGRVMGLYVLLFAGSTPIGALLIGAASNTIGAPAALLLCAALCAIGVGVALLYRHRTLDRVSL